MNQQPEERPASMLLLSELKKKTIQKSTLTLVMRVMSLYS